MKITQLITPDLPKQIDILFNKVLKLNEAERDVLIILSVIYKPVGITKLNEIINLLHNEGVLSGRKPEYKLSTTDRERLVRGSVLESSQEGLRVNRILANKLTQNVGLISSVYDFTAEQKLLHILAAGERIVPVVVSNSWQNKVMDKQRLMRDFYFLGETNNLIYKMNINKNPQIVDYAENRILFELCFLPFNLQDFLQLPNIVQYYAFATLIREFQVEGTNCEYPISLLEQVCNKSNRFNKNNGSNADAANADNEYCQLLLAEQYLYQANFDKLSTLLGSLKPSAYLVQIEAVSSFIKGDIEHSISLFEQALIAKNKIARRKKQYLPDILGLFYKLALTIKANQQDAGLFSVAVDQVIFEEDDKKLKSEFFNLGQGLLRIIRSLSSGAEYQNSIEYTSVQEQIDFLGHHLDYLIFLLSQVWCNQSSKSDVSALAKRYQTNFECFGYNLFGQYCAQIYAKLTGQTPPLINGVANITEHIQIKEKWDIALDKLISLAPIQTSPSDEPESKENKTSRLIWVLNDFDHSISPREQKLSHRGWTKGRAVSLKKLHEQTDSYDYLNETDKILARTIYAQQGWGYYSKTEYFLSGLNALENAVGIENLYHHEDIDHPIELIRREPELLVNQVGDELCLSISDFSFDIENYDTQQVYDLKPINQHQYQLTVFSKEHIEVAKIIGDEGLLIPKTAKQKALDGISAIAPLLNIQSNLEELDTGLETKQCDRHLIVNVQPTQNGLSFTCVVMPFGEEGPAFVPGLGNANLTAEINNKRIATVRDLAYEETLLDQLDSTCPAFLNMYDNTLELDDIQSSLIALEQLEAAHSQQQFALKVRWPKGKKISLSRPLKSEHLALAVNKSSEWFDITGDLQIDNERVIALRQLLNLIKTSNGRFIELEDSQILSLSQDLREKLELINQLTDDGKLHPLASLQLQEAVSGMRLKTIHAWEKQTQKMHESNEITPILPSTFQAHLRDYQMQGFEWAMRLAHWGAGACLADDMGLGKTLQALAVLLARANDGPSLVIAPTSVCLNWQQEALKFAPTLNIKLFADLSGNQARLALLDELVAFDCVIISYGLLQRASDILKEVHWHTVVADEAQALKNPLTKRSKAAFALKADFKMITTGTPIENDLSELWSLFRFINPGLLGNAKRFAQRFIIPIENSREDKLAARKASQGIKALIQPFILRRMKTQVLSELPPRTEINVPVQMSDQERDFYEALRLNAIDNITQNNEQSNMGEQRIKMLAELTKLRQACCHPKLVFEETTIPSSKLEALDNLLIDLKQNNHKALIFSQFVGHLQIIKQHLEKRKIEFQYLDGSTPQKERQKRVNAFQSGQGDVFLISLKAGGSGLNLTAADYVIHMDPWWNPAVEEQASDRAHRMGQKRPVTIYRLITQNTIEEKIVALHQRKRDLADTLLSGNEVASKLSVEDMLNLLKETF